MKKLKMMMACVLAVFALGACDDQDLGNRSETQTIATDGDYAAVLPFHASDARQKHTSVISDQGERFNIVTGLMELSKSHFNPNDVAFKESQFLTYDILDASDYSTGLLGRASDSNPDGLNQRRDESFDTGNGSSANGIAPLIDIYELFRQRSVRHLAGDGRHRGNSGFRQQQREHLAGAAEGVCGDPRQEAQQLHAG